MTERPTERLTTADMAAAAERRPTEPIGTPPPGERDRAPAMASAHQADTSRRAAQDAQATALFAAEETRRFRERWDDVQTGFVDEPRRAVEQADSLVAEVMKRLAEIFADERSKLESQWGRGDNVSTEDLRVALRRYRSFFDRLLTYGGQTTEMPGSAPRERAGMEPAARTEPMAAAAPTTSAGAAPPMEPTGRPAATAATARWEDEMPRVRTQWEQRHGADGSRWQDYEPCYRYSWEMRQDPRYRDRPWPEVEPDLRRDWEMRHPDTPWERVADTVRDGWESLTGARAR